MNTSGEAAGDPSKLKSSLLEEYAASHGITAKAYDFRRDPAVRAHISYLRQLVSDESAVSVLSCDSYKTLDIRAILSKYHDQDSLISVLSEMDAYWKNVYDAAQSANNALSECRNQISDLQSKLQTAMDADSEQAADIRSLKSENYRLSVENRYLRSMLRTYLYPALANRILQEEHVVQGGSEALSKDAATTLIDGSFPSSASDAISSDRSLQAEEQAILLKMWDSIGGFNEN
jgi:regulator of replication initiation timing